MLTHIVIIHEKRTDIKSFLISVLIFKQQFSYLISGDGFANGAG